jgi:superfamily II DNA or RNA helicase
MHLLRKDPDKGYLDDMLWIPKSQINVEGTKNALSFKYSNEKEERYVFLYEEREHHLLVPRSFWQLKDLNFPVIDCRPLGFKEVDFKSKVTLDAKNPAKSVQRDAMAALLASEGGVLQLACGTGKTVVALDYIARMRRPAIIAVDNTQLLKQWVDEIEKWLEVPGGYSIAQGSDADWSKDLIITTYKTLGIIAGSMSEATRRRFGVFVGDEGHHIPAPTYAKVASLFYGKRLALTATPERVDGMHVVTEFHFGPVIYKYMLQELRPRICFIWTGFQIDEADKEVAEEVCDVNGELHLSKLASYFGRWRPRLEYIISQVRKAEISGRRILVLSNSVEELINLLALWTHEKELLFELPPITPADVGEKLDPVPIPPREYNRKIARYHELKKAMKDAGNNPVKQRQFKLILDRIQQELKQHEVHEKIESEYNKRLKDYMQRLLLKNSNAGLMIGALKPALRQQLLKSKQVVFAITKYGREGLDNPDLDTVFTCEPMSQKNGLQQFMGRVLRIRAGKQTPFVGIFEDDVGPMKGMCENLRRHLRTWPAEEGGPYEYELIGHPRKGKQPPTRW